MPSSLSFSSIFLILIACLSIIVFSLSLFLSKKTVFRLSRGGVCKKYQRRFFGKESFFFFFLDHLSSYLMLLHLAENIENEFLSSFFLALENDGRWMRVERGRREGERGRERERERKRRQRVFLFHHLGSPKIFFASSPFLPTLPHRSFRGERKKRKREKERTLQTLCSQASFPLSSSLFGSSSIKDAKANHAKKEQGFKKF